MRYIETTIEEAIEVLKQSKGKKVMIDVHDLTCDDVNEEFCFIVKNECNVMIQNAETIASIVDDFAKSLRLFTEKQNLRDIKPIGLERIILLRE